MHPRVTLVTFLRLALLLAAFHGNASGTLIIQDSFNYPTGDLSIGTTGGIWSRTGSGDSIQIVTSTLSYPDYSDGSGNQVQWGGDGKITRTDFAAVSSGSIYASFLYRMDTLGSLTTAGGAVAGMVNAGNTANPNSRVYLRKDASDGTKFNFGVLEKNSAVSWSTSQMTVGVTYLIVFSLDFLPGATDDTARLWINPSVASFGAGSPPAADITASGGSDATTVNRFRLVQNPAGGSPDLQTFDELRIGTSWADVLPAVIPEPSSALLALLSAGLLLRRRR